MDGTEVALKKIQSSTPEVTQQLLKQVSDEGRFWEKLIHVICYICSIF